MAQDDHDPGGTGGGGTGTPACRSAKDILNEVTAKINAYESQKLGELKAALDTFVKNQEQVVDGYRTKFPALRKTWCERQQDVERLYAHLKCEFPLDNEKWQKLIQECICRKKHAIQCQKKRIARRKRCCSGPLQQARDAAQAAFDVAKAELDVLQALAQKIADALAANLNVIGEIEKLPANERAVALWLFWGKLLENHKSLAPKDISDACKNLGNEGQLAVLCKVIYGEECTPKEDGCTPPTSYDDADPAEPRGPWLMPPDDYQTALDCAWEKYHKAKGALADAEAAYKANPDDLASLEKALVDDLKGLEDEIKKCLKKEKPSDDCCKPSTGTGRTGA